MGDNTLVKRRQNLNSIETPGHSTPNNPKKSGILRKLCCGSSKPPIRRTIEIPKDEKPSPLEKKAEEVVSSPVMSHLSSFVVDGTIRPCTVTLDDLGIGDRSPLSPILESRSVLPPYSHFPIHRRDTKLRVILRDFNTNIVDNAEVQPRSPVIETALSLTKGFTRSLHPISSSPSNLKDLSATIGPSSRRHFAGASRCISPVILPAIPLPHTPSIVDELDEMHDGVPQMATSQLSNSTIHYMKTSTAINNPSGRSLVGSQQQTQTMLVPEGGQLKLNDSSLIQEDFYEDLSSVVEDDNDNSIINNEKFNYKGNNICDRNRINQLGVHDTSKFDTPPRSSVSMLEKNILGVKEELHESIWSRNIKNNNYNNGIESNEDEDLFKTPTQRNRFSNSAPHNNSNQNNKNYLPAHSSFNVHDQQNYGEYDDRKSATDEDSDMNSNYAWSITSMAPLAVNQMGCWIAETALRTGLEFALANSLTSYQPSHALARPKIVSTQVRGNSGAEGLFSCDTNDTTCANDIKYSNQSSSEQSNGNALLKSEHRIEIDERTVQKQQRFPPTPQEWAKDLLSRESIIR